MQCDLQFTNCVSNNWQGMIFNINLLNLKKNFYSWPAEYCKRGNIRGTLIFADFAVFQQARIQKPAKIFAIFCMHILDK